MEEERRQRHGVADNLQRFTHNGLRSKPLVRGLVPGYLLPVWHWIWSPLATSTLYYTLVRNRGGNFAGDLGRLFEAYLGRQLRLMQVPVLGEIPYYEGKNHKLSVDFFVDFDDLTVLVECKSSRPDASVVMANDDMFKHIDTYIGKATKQINGSFHRLSDLVPQLFESSKAQIGIIVTMEHYQDLILALQHQTAHPPVIPTVVLSISQIERLMTLDGEAVKEVLLRGARNASPVHNGYFDISTTVDPLPFQDNRILTEAFDTSILAKFAGDVGSADYER
ncbi:hypothetical protein [Clavibacter michiganensis]|uniref:hypothetical protein n=1 Tax=Clavibacter michiganensis TaxID=28447 RepID=UPI003EB6BAD4